MTKLMLKSKIAKVVMAGTCFTLISAGSAFAAEPATLEAAISGNGSSAEFIGQVAGDYELAPRHQEIDRLLFEDGGLEKFQAAGFTVTHTGPINDVIEIGITPYDDSYAEMVIELVGEDQVQVVEGVQAVPLMAGPDTSVSSSDDVAEPTFSTMVVGAPEAGEGEAVITSIPEDGLDMPVSDGPDSLDSVGTDDGAIVEDARVISAPADDAGAIAEDVQVISAPAETGAPSASNVWPWVAAIAAGLAAAGLIIRKVLVSKK